MADAGGSQLDNVVIVLVEPRDPVNIAATLRAMKNMGAGRLRLVNPVAYEPERLVMVAHDTQDLIASITHHPSLEAAISDCVLAAGYTARRRSAKRERINPEACATIVLEGAREGTVALVFGREDRGLSNDELDRANILVTIPTTNYASLNLGQAVLIALYELHLAAADSTRKLAPPRKDAPPASSHQYEQLFADGERALDAMDFFKTRARPRIMRTVRSLAYRAAPDAREISLLRAIAFEVLRTIDRVRGRP